MPEPARLTSNLKDSYGATTAAVFGSGPQSQQYINDIQGLMTTLAGDLKSTSNLVMAAIPRYPRYAPTAYINKRRENRVGSDEKSVMLVLQLMQVLQKVIAQSARDLNSSSSIALSNLGPAVAKLAIEINSLKIDVAKEKAVVDAAYKQRLFSS